MHQKWENSTFVVDVLFFWPLRLVFFYLTGIVALWRRPAAKWWKSKNSSSPPLNRTDSACPSVVMLAPTRVSPARFSPGTFSPAATSAARWLRRSWSWGKAPWPSVPWWRLGSDEEEEHDRCPWPDKHAAIENYKSIYKANTRAISNVIHSGPLVWHLWACGSPLLLQIREISHQQGGSLHLLPIHQSARTRATIMPHITHSARSTRLKVRD